MSKNLNVCTEKSANPQTSSDFRAIKAVLEELLKSKEDSELDSILELCRSMSAERSDEMVVKYLEESYRSLISPGYMLDLMPSNMVKKYEATFVSDDNEALENDWMSVGDELWAAWAAHTIEQKRA